jgi:transposase
MLLHDLSKHYNSNSVPHGIQTTLAERHGVSQSTVSSMALNGDVEEAAKSRRLGKGRPLKYTAEELNERISKVPLESRKSLKDLSEAIGASKNTVFPHFKKMKQMPHVLSSNK